MTTAFLIGFFGSFHCIGMCSPIALALPLQAQSRWAILQSRILYNTGRIVTYSLLGILVGLLGKSLALSSSQQWLSILIGLLILLFIFLPPQLTSSWGILKPIQSFTVFLKQQFARLFKQKTALSYFLIGFVNGFLPCGLVYLALAGALATGEVLEGVLYMSFFGLGTFPMMFAVSMAGNFIKPSVRRFIYKKLLPSFTLVLALLFILRGLNLNIPYISPQIVKKTPQEVDMDCCHK
jgi:uncharacterized protein